MLDLYPHFIQSKIIANLLRYTNLTILNIDSHFYK